MKPHFLLAALALTAAFLLQSRNGTLQYLDCAAGRWHDTGMPVTALANEADRAVLSCGLPLLSRAELTRALEDFCS